MGNLQKQMFRRKIDIIREYVFMISFSVLLVIHCLENTALVYNADSWMSMLYTLKKIIYLLLVAKIVFLSTFSIIELFVTVVVLVIMGVGYYCCGDFGLLELGIILVSAKDIDIKHISQPYFYIKGFAIPLTIFAWRIGVIPTLYYKNENGFYNTMGFCHRNVLGANITILCIAWFFLRYNKVGWSDIIIWSVLARTVYILAYSRSSTIIILLTVMSVSFFRLHESRILPGKISYAMLSNTVIIFLVISITCTLLYSNKSVVWKYVDAIFTRRFSFSKYCLSTYGISIWGQKIPFVNSLQAQKLGSDKLILDNAYTRAIIYYGLLPGGLFLWVNNLVIKTAWLKKDGAAVICLVIMAIYGLSERYMMDAYYQLPLILAYRYCFSSKGQKY